MFVMSPVRSDERISFHAEKLDEMISALGTPAFGQACLRVFEKMLDVEHWALFRYVTPDLITCVATASRVHANAAKENVERFVENLHLVDPSMAALRQRRSDTACLTKLEFDDISDDRYRHCYETTRVQERLSYVCRYGGDTYQASIYRGPRRHSYSSSEMKRFTPLARFVVSTASKHEKLLSKANTGQSLLDMDGIERLLMKLPGRLSRREREVCSRAAVGKTIEGTALELDIGITSVITYRQRAYKKLGISRQNELVAMVANLRTSSALAS